MCILSNDQIEFLRDLSWSHLEMQRSLRSGGDGQEQTGERPRALWKDAKHVLSVTKLSLGSPSPGLSLVGTQPGCSSQPSLSEVSSGTDFWSMECALTLCSPPPPICHLEAQYPLQTLSGRTRKSRHMQKAWVSEQEQEGQILH